MDMTGALQCSGGQKFCTQKTASTAAAEAVAAALSCPLPSALTKMQAERDITTKYTKENFSNLSATHVPLGTTFLKS